MPKKTETGERLDAIGESVFFRIKESQVRFLEEQNKNRIGGIHVTSWNKACPRYIWYGIQPKQDPYSIDAETASHFYFGHLVHTTTDLKGKTHEMTMAYDFINKKVIENPKEFVFTEDNKYDILVGTNDDLITVENLSDYGFVIVDKKTFNSEKYTPRSASEDYILQLNLYRVLLNKCLGIDAKYGTIAYIDIATKGLKHVEFTHELVDIDETLMFLQTQRAHLLNTKNTGELPPRKFTFLCDGYCPYYYRCMLNK